MSFSIFIQRIIFCYDYLLYDPDDDYDYDSWLWFMIIIHDYDNDCESGDPKMEYSDGGDDDTVMPVHY